MSILSDIGEQSAIKLLTESLSSKGNVITGPGDDCAVVRINSESDTDLVLTSDPVIQDVHFTSDCTPEAIGHKAVGRVLSDIAAMGAQPEWALINLTAPADTDTEFLRRIMASASALASKYNMSITGGDIAKNDKLELHVFGIGTAPRDKAILRTSSKVGDLIYVTGELGGSREGKHCSFEPRVSEGLFLRDRATSMIDVTDGLATELKHILADGIGAIIKSSSIPLSPSSNGIQGALTDGEDFELLFTIPKDQQSRFEADWAQSIRTDVTMIGSITDKADIVEIQDENGSITTLDTEGYQHF